MKRLSVLGAIAALLVLAGTVVATPGSGLAGVILARTTFDEVSFLHNAGTEVVFQDVTIAPAGHTGWHTHPGDTVVLVESGTFSFYDAECTLTTVEAGRGVVEVGGQIQLARNEGTEPLVLTVVYFDVPVGGAVRSDAAVPDCATTEELPNTAAGTGVTAPIINRAVHAGGATMSGVDERQVVVQQITVAPGGHSGWHSHPGAAVINVASGTFTLVNEQCQATTVAAGQGIVEPAGMRHLARNDGTVPYVIFVAFFDVPAGTGTEFRVDEAAPACAAPSPTAAALPNTAANSDSTFALLPLLAAAILVSSGAALAVTWTARGRRQTG